MKTDPLPPILLLGLIAGLCPLPTAVRAADNANLPPPIFTSPQNAGTDQPAVAVQNTVPAAPRLSAGLDEIVKLHKAGVEEGVMLAFIQNSPVAYRPSAQEILMLRESGISAPILTALMQRGGEVRQHAIESAPPARAAASAPAGASPPPVPEPTPVQPAPASNGDPAAHSAAPPTVVYATYPSYGGYGYPYYDPGYYGYYGGWYPGLSIGFGFGGGYYGGGYCGGYYGGYYGGHGGRVYPANGHGGSSGSITGAKGNAGYPARNSGGQVSTVKGSGGYSGGYTAARVSSVQGGGRSSRR